MDKLYIGDIPKDYKYAVITNDYIRLFNKPYGRDENLSYFQIYNNDSGFFYSSGMQNFSSYNTTYFTELDVTDSIVYRKDFDKITVVSFIFILGLLFLVNLVTSVFKQNGVLGGLLWFLRLDIF